MLAPNDNWIVVLQARTERQCTEAGLVLVALGIKHEVARVAGEWRLVVPPESAARAFAELAAYRRENDEPLGGARPLEELETGWRGVIVYVGILLGLAMLTSQGAFGVDWLTAGRLDTGRVISGEWWRAVTALTLHVDASHLAANLAFGSFFGLYVGRYLGSGIGWAVVVGGGVLGNLINALLQPSHHRAIGASTAVFAALGLLAAYNWRKGFRKNTPWKTRIAPVIAGIALLAFTGSGAGSDAGTVDVVAHLTGFVSGFGLGVIVARHPIPTEASAQKLAVSVTLGGLAAAWLAALGLAG